MFFLRLKLYFYKVREPHTESPASKDNHYNQNKPHKPPFVPPHVFPHVCTSQTPQYGNCLHIIMQLLSTTIYVNRMNYCKHYFIF